MNQISVNKTTNKTDNKTKATLVDVYTAQM